MRNRGQPRTTRPGPQLLAYLNSRRGQCWTTRVRTEMMSESEFDAHRQAVIQHLADPNTVVQGSITNPNDVSRALNGVDTFINMVMKGPQGGSVTDQNLTQIVENYEVNTLGLHVLLWTAQGVGIKRGVYTSSMSVHYRERPFFDTEELVAYDTPSMYGLTKGFGEQICQYFARRVRHEPRRVAYYRPPRTRAVLASAPARNPVSATCTGPTRRTWRAYLAALEAVQVGHGRFEAVFIAGDEHEREHNLSKATRLLGWQPTSQRHLVSD